MPSRADYVDFHWCESDPDDFQAVTTPNGTLRANDQAFRAFVASHR